MNENNPLESVLAELRQEHQATALPGAAEDRFLQAVLLAQASSRQPLRPRCATPLAWGAGSAIAAAILLGLTLWLVHHSAPEPQLGSVLGHLPGIAGGTAQQNPAAGNHATPAALGPPPIPAASTSSNLSRRKAQTHSAAQSHWSAETVRHTRPVARKQQPLIETGFLVIPGSEGLPTPSEASIIRVQLTKGDLQWYGFQVPPSSAAEMVRADFLVGQDGLARAIRLVQHR